MEHCFFEEKGVEGHSGLERTECLGGLSLQGKRSWRLRVLPIGGENELNAEKSRWRTSAEGDRVRKRDCRPPVGIGSGMIVINSSRRVLRSG